MPVDSHLNTVDISDFSGGLWTENRIFMPANAAQTMQDCYPIKPTGLRAWFKPTAVTLTGIVSIANETVEGLHTSISTIAGANDLYLITYNTSDTKYRVYRLPASAPTSWVLLFTTVVSTHAVAPCRFGTFYNVGDSQNYVIFTLPQGISADNGTYAIKRVDGTVTKLSVHSSTMLVPYQNRILIGGPNVDPDGGASVYFSDAGLFTNIDVNKATTDNTGQVAALAAFSPGDLLVFKGSSIDLLQGDLTNYTLRTMSQARPLTRLVDVTYGPDGVIWVSGDGVWVTPDGQQVFALGKSITPSYWQQKILVTYIDHWFYANGKLILDYNSKGWFSTSFVDDAAFASTKDSSANALYVATSGVNFTIYKYSLTDGTSNRAESYTWKSAPIRDPQGAQIEIRQVEVYHQTFNGATSTISVTVNGVTRSLACDSGGRGGATFYFMARREYLDIQVTCASNASGVEAPLIEAIKVGARSGHYLPGTADVG